MTPVERLQAAIEKLERLKAASTPGPWETELDDGEGEVQINAGSARTAWSENGTGRPASSWKSTDRILERDDLWDDEFEQVAADAELIETLHRTIDAQLEMLRAGWNTIAGTEELPDGKNPKVWYGRYAAAALALADAILGSDL